MKGSQAVQLPKTYAFVSHESAVEAVWALAKRDWQGVLDDENAWLIPSAENCVTSQSDFRRLSDEVDLDALGIRRKPVDLLVPDKSCYSRGKQAKFHVWSDFFPPHSFVRVHDRVFVSTPYFVSLQLAAGCRADRLSKAEAEASAEEDAQLRTQLGLEGSASSVAELVRWGNIARLARAVQVMSDFMGTYRYVPEGDAESDGYHVVYGTQPLVAPESFASYLGKMKAARGIERARKVSGLAFARAASPMETMLALVLSFPQDMGGFGLPRPTLNQEVAIPEEDREIASQECIFADLCWPEKRVIVEYHGWDEHFGAGPRKVASDAARTNTLTSLGWTVLHATYEQVRTISGVSLLARQLARALEMELEAPSDLELVWRSRLIALLLPKTVRDL